MGCDMASHTNFREAPQAKSRTFSAWNFHVSGAVPGPAVRLNSPATPGVDPDVLGAGFELDGDVVAYAMTIDLQEPDARYERTLTTLRDQFGAEALAFFAPLATPADASNHFGRGEVFAMVPGSPGFPEGIDGYQLMQNLRKQAEKFGSGEADEQAALLAVGGRGVAQCAFEEAAEDITHADGGHAGTDSGETCTDQLCCFCVHYTTPWV